MRRYYGRMGVFLLAVFCVGGFLHQTLFTAFLHNPPLNGLICAVLILGIFLAFYHLYRLRQEEHWLRCYDKGQENFPGSPTPQILMPLAIVLTEMKSGTTLPTITIRSVLSGIESRLEESRDMVRYMVGLLVFLGLLGTFWGLSQTISAIAGVVSGLDVSANDIGMAFDSLKQGLQSPLKGMGTAFSSSLFGLAGSLILGFLDLQTARASGYFYHTLEERLTFISRINTGSGDVENSGMAYSHSLLEQVIESTSQLQNTIRKGEDNRTTVVRALKELSNQLSPLSDHLSQQNQRSEDLQRCFIELAKVLQRPAKEPNQDLKNHLRSLDETTQKLLEELLDGRQKNIEAISEEIRLVARTVSAVGQKKQEIAA